MSTETDAKTDTEENDSSVAKIAPSSSTILIYKFLDERFALKSLREKRLRISELDDLNDPFDLMPYDLSDRQHRTAARAARQTLCADHGLLCFSADWHDPVIWAHYSDKHRGICLGFEIPENVSRRIEYVDCCLPFPLEPTLADSQKMLFTKYRNWAYEKEVRVWSTLKNREPQGCFFDFDEKLLRLTKVIVGARSAVSKAEVEDAAAPLSVPIIKARAAFTKFEIVEDQRGFE